MQASGKGIGQSWKIGGDSFVHLQRRWDSIPIYHRIGI